MTSPLRRKRLITLPNTTKARTPYKVRRNYRLAGRLGLGVLAVLTSLAISSIATAADPTDSSSGSQSSGSHLVWRPYRPDRAAPRPAESNPLRNGQWTSHDAVADNVHRDTSIVRVQSLAAADPASNPFGDEPADNKAKKPADLPSPGPATTAPTLPDPDSSPATPPKFKTPDAAPAKLPPSDPFPLDPPKTKAADGSPFGQPEPGPQPKTPAIPPAIITTPNPTSDVNTTTGKIACDKELADLIANTVDKVRIDITPRLDPPGGQLPGECGLGEAAFVPRDWPCLTYTWKASALCHKPLYFEEPNLERYGHSRGPVLDPLVSAAHFFVCVPLLPYEMGVKPPCECEYSLGYYRPGSCAPWIINGFPISLRGMVLECTVATGAAFAIP